MARQACFSTLAARALVVMQLLRVALSLSLAPSALTWAADAEAHVEARPILFLDRTKELPDLSKFNDQILVLRKKIDSLTLQCKVTQLKDDETLSGLDRELRVISGQLAANLAQQSAAQNAEASEKAASVKLKGQLVQLSSMCRTQKKSLNTTAGMLLRDQQNAESLRGLSSQCRNALLTALHSSVAAANSSERSVSFMQDCGQETTTPILEAGKALEMQANEFMTEFAKKGFDDAVQRAYTTSPVILISDEAWPSKSNPPSKAKAKSANACKLAKGSVNCDKLKSQLETLAKRLEEQKESTITNQRKQVEECEHKETDLKNRIKSTDAQHARSTAELVRLTGIKAGLASSRASIVQRLERTKRDAKKFSRTCNAGADEYKGKLEDIMKARQKVANGDSGEKVALQDCKVTEWLFSKCSKPCKKLDNETAGTMEATRDVAQVAGFGGASCPPLSAKLPCNDKPCPIDCVVSEWVKWSECSKACGGGTTKRTRKVITQVQNAGKACPLTEERKSCNVGSCSDECKLKPWSPWSACSRRCRFSKTSASGRQDRVREIKGNPMMRGGGSPCPPADDKTRLQTRTCNPEICPKGITCDASQDILFILDASGSAGKNFQRQVSLVMSIAKDSSEKVHVGAVAFGKEVKILSRITGDRKQLQTLSSYTPPAGGSRDASKGEVMGGTLFGDPNVGRGRPKIAVLLLGGAPSGFPEAQKAAKELRSSGVRLVVGLVDDGSQVARDQACSLASTPCEANVEAVSSWEQMAQEPGRFLASLCRDLVYPGPKLSDLDEMMVKKGRKRKSFKDFRKAKKGNYGEDQMPNFMKRRLKIP